MFLFSDMDDIDKLVIRGVDLSSSIYVKSVEDLLILHQQLADRAMRLIWGYASFLHRRIYLYHLRSE